MWDLKIFFCKLESLLFEPPIYFRFLEAVAQHMTIENSCGDHIWSAKQNFRKVLKLKLEERKERNNEKECMNWGIDWWFVNQEIINPV